MIKSSYPEYTEFLLINKKNTDNKIQKWARDLEYIQIANKHMKRLLLSLEIKEMQMKTTMHTPTTPFRITNFKKISNIRG
jgi:hypothetical protein